MAIQEWLTTHNVKKPRISIYEKYVQEDLDKDFVKQNISPFLEGSYLFCGFLSKGTRLDIGKGTSIANVALTKNCMEEAIRHDPSTWHKIVHHIIEKTNSDGLDRECIGWLYELYNKYSEIIIDDYDSEQMGDLMFRLAETGNSEWIKIWYGLDQDDRIIQDREWFMSLLATISNGYLTNVKWFFIHTGIRWKVQEELTKFSMVFHAVDYHDILFFLDGEECVREDTGIIEEFVKTADYEMLSWAECGGFT